MIVVRDIFRLKFGQSKDAIAAWKSGAAALKKSSAAVMDVRLLTDLVGSPYYTIILESTFASLADWENTHKAARDNAEWHAIYAKIMPLTETGHREILSLL